MRVRRNMKTGFISCFTFSLYIMAERKSYTIFERDSYQDFERDSYEGSEEMDYLINIERKEESRLESKKICLGKGSCKNISLTFI
jgi:hypothetical protein